MPGRLQASVLAEAPDFNWPPTALQITDDGSAFVEGTVGDSARVTRIELPEAALPENVQRVGLALVAKFPVSLELAGVILTMAMFGAVVLARKQIDLEEDETREAAGLPRYSFDEDEEPPAPWTGSEA